MYECETCGSNRIETHPPSCPQYGLWDSDGNPIPAVPANELPKDPRNLLVHDPTVSARQARRALGLADPDNPCEICGVGDSEKPMCFRGDPYCSDIHRKLLEEGKTT